MTLLTNEEYAVYHADVCPGCKGEDDVESTGTPVWYGGLRLYLPVRCGYCGATWEEVYLLEGYINFELENESESTC